MNSADIMPEVLESLGKDYLSISLIETDTRMVYPLKSTRRSVLRRNGKFPALSYDDIAAKSMNGHVPADKKEEYTQKTSLDTVVRELQTKEEYSFSYESIVDGQTRRGQMRFVKLPTDGYILMTYRYVDQAVFAEHEKAQRAEEERQRAVKANEMKSRFLSSLSHDVRTPINAIQGMLRIADTYPKDMKKQAECREKMWMASNYLGGLVNNVLDMNRLENTDVHLTSGPFNMIDLLMEVSSMAGVQAEEQGLRCVVDWKPGYIEHRYLLGSAEGLSRILTNLNSNAIKYNKQGGSIYCRCKELRCDGDTAWFELITKDTGIGMDKEFLAHAFEPYAQKYNPSLNSINGVGLGLAIVKKMVDIMGGTMQVDSEVGKGTTYTIVLPFKIDPNPHKVETNYEHLSLNGVKALLVEDNNLNMEIAKFYLEQEKVQVYTAMNGQEAVEMFRKSDVGFYDIILMDIMMPIMDGLEATREIRAMNRPDALAIPLSL
ncbi:hybrid sensor histidine kinase/response regulator [Gemmiger sp.]